MENVGIGENAGHQLFFLFSHCFQKASSLESLSKALADNQLNITKMIILICARVENSVGKRENAGYQYFLLYPQCFQKASSLELLSKALADDKCYSSNYFYLR